MPRLTSYPEFMHYVWKDISEILRLNQFTFFTYYLDLISRAKWFTPEEKVTGLVTLTDNLKKKKVVNINMAINGIF